MQKTAGIKIDHTLSFDEHVSTLCGKAAQKVHRINSIHERALRLVYDDYISSFKTLLLKDNSVSIHIRNIQALATELYKVTKGISTEIMGLVFPLRESLRYPSMNIFQTRNVRTVTYGTSSLAYLNQKNWTILPVELKNLSSLQAFKQKIRNWNPSNCPCKLCIPYIANMGYLNQCLVSFISETVACKYSPCKNKEPFI